MKDGVKFHLVCVEIKTRYSLKILIRLEYQEGYMNTLLQSIAPFQV